MRRSVANTVELESLLVDTNLKEHNIFASFYRTEGEAKLYFNTSSSSSEPLQVTASFQQHFDDNAQLQLNIKVLNPGDWLDVRINLEDDESNAYTFNGHLKAPSELFLSVQHSR